MKINRTYLFIAISSIALIILLVIQVNWIMETARIKEALFNEKANMVLSRTAETLRSDKNACMSVELGCVNPNTELELTLGKAGRRNIDSLLSNYMELYNFHVDYSFVLVKPAAGDPKKTVQYGDGSMLYRDQKDCFKTCLDDDISSNGLELKLIVPDKDQFIRQEMGTMFMSSVVLILVVLALFWRTTLSLLKEKEISEHTTEFLNNMTHEFKTPLTNISLAGKMMLKESNIKQEDKIKHYSGIILDENEKLSRQVEQVLSMTALERGEIPLQKTELDMHDLIREAIKCISVQVESKQGDLKLKLEAQNVIVYADKTHLTNAICNLVDNAIKYTSQKPELEILTSNSNGNLVIEVKDNGIGIAKEYHEKVFATFFRVPTGNIHDVKGFGLGLAYVKKIVELHDGRIDLESEIEKGTKFTITLPNA